MRSGSPRLLPAWSAQSEHDLGAAAELGFGPAASALAALLPPEPRGHAFEAKQVALARYTRTGFEAAAITAIAQRAGMAMPQYRDGLIRTARLEFVRPFAVVAVAADRMGGRAHAVGRAAGVLRVGHRAGRARLRRRRISPAGRG